MSKKTFRDLKDIIDLQEGEIEELTMELNNKNEKINKLTLYTNKLKYENKSLELKVNSKINNEKSKLNELDNLQEKINEKERIIDDKHDQVLYLRELIDDYRCHINEITDNLESQLKKVSKTYENLLSQKDLIIEKQDETIKNLIKSNEEITKSNKTNILSLDIQNKKYQKIIDKYIDEN